MKLFAFPSLNSIRTRLTLWNVGILALVLVTLGAVFNYRVRTVALSAVDRRMADSAHHFQEMAADPPPFPDAPRPDLRLPEEMRRLPWFAPNRPERGPNGELRPRLLNRGGEPMLPPNALPGSLAAPAWDAASVSPSLGGRERFSTIRVNGEAVRVLSFPLRRAGKIFGVAQFARSLEQIQQDEAQMTRILLTLIPFALLVAGLGGAFLTDRALRPVRRITDTASQIEAGSLSGRLTVTGSDEFAELAETINGMLGRLEQAFSHLEKAYEQQRRFTADASHELRTPLTIIKANASLALTGTRTAPDYQKTLRAVDAAADRMNRIVQDLLLLARSDAGQLTCRLVPTRLSEILPLSLAAVPGSEHAPILLDVSPPSLQVLGDADTLVRLFSNLLENAARYTPAEGRICVSAANVDEAVLVTVTDSGEGIAPEHLPHVTERFYRVDAARARAQGGTGLGLAICRSIVDMHGGHLQIESVPGQGTIIQVTLPFAPNEPPLFSD